MAQEVVACYFELYEEGEVEHINSPTYEPTLIGYEQWEATQRAKCGFDCEFIWTFSERVVNIAV